MSVVAATRATPASSSVRPSVRRSVWKHGVAASVVAAVATTSLAAAASAAGVSFADRSGSAIPVAGFAQITLVFSLLGVALAAVLARRAARPRTMFLRTTIALTVLSVVPDATFGFDVTSAATLMALHAIAAAIVIPTLSRRLG